MVSFFVPLALQCMHPFHTPVHASVHASVHRPPTRPFTRPFTRPPTHPLTRPFTRPFTRPLTRPLTCLLTRPLINVQCVSHAHRTLYYLLPSPRGHERSGCGCCGDPLQVPLVRAAGLSKLVSRCVHWSPILQHPQKSVPSPINGQSTCVKDRPVILSRSQSPIESARRLPCGRRSGLVLVAHARVWGQLRGVLPSRRQLPRPPADHLQDRSE